MVNQDNSVQEVKGISVLQKATRLKEELSNYLGTSPKCTVPFSFVFMSAFLSDARAMNSFLK